MRGRTRPALLVPVLAVGMLAFASSSILVRAAGDVAPAALIAGRTALAVLFLLPLAPRAASDVQAHAGHRGGHWILGAGVLLALHFGLWIESLSLTSVASASVLVTTTPVQIVLIDGIRTRRWPTPGMLVAVTLGAVGAVLIGVGDAAGDVTSEQTGRAPLVGNALAFLAATVMALYLGVASHVRQRLTWAGYVLPVYAVVAACALAYALATGTLGELGTGATLAWCAAMALGPQIVGHGATNYAVRYVSPLLLGLLSLLEPIGASAMARLFFDEQPGLLSLIGMAMCLVAVALALVASARAARTG